MRNPPLDRPLTILDSQTIANASPFTYEWPIRLRQ